MTDDVTTRCSDSPSPVAPDTSDVINDNNNSAAAASVVGSSVITSGSSSSVCRDFLRNVCRRGDRCRFAHPADPTSARRDVIDTTVASGSGRVVFCHDFQNATGCRRGSACRFAHCTRLEEAVYRRTGLLPVGVGRKLVLDAAVARALWRGETPVCIDFLKTGNCRRASGKCRYRHVTREEFDREQTTTPMPTFVTSYRAAAADDVTSTSSERLVTNRKRKAPSVDDDYDDNDDDDRRYDVIVGSQLQTATTDNFRFLQAATPTSAYAVAGYPVTSGMRLLLPVTPTPAAMPTVITFVPPAPQFFGFPATATGLRYDVIADRLPAVYCGAPVAMASSSNADTSVAMATRLNARLNACQTLQFC